MTVNELLAELRKLQKEGRGSNRVFQHVPGDRTCPRTAEVKKYHTVKNGHIVIISEQRPPEVEGWCGLMRFA